MSKKNINIKPFFYHIGDIVQTNTGSIKVIDLVRGQFKPSDRFNYKYIKYQCEKCNYIDYVMEYDLKNGLGCKVCGKNIVVTGVNDIATLYPEKVHFFWNIEDAKHYKKSSNKKADFKCECCGNKILNKNIGSMMKLDYLLCPLCKDNTISWGEKMMWSILNQLQEKFIHDNTTTWSDGRRYDFLLPDKNVIIEIDGMQHSLRSFNLKRSKTVEQIKENDLYKTKLAEKHGYKVYRVNYLKNSINDFLSEVKNNLSNVLEVEKIDVNLIKQDMIRPLDSVCSDLWNMGDRSTTIIANKLHLNPNRVRIALKKSSELGHCDYNADDARRLKNILPEERKYTTLKPVICLNNLFIFNRMAWAFRYADTKKVLEACKGKRKHAGKDPETGEKLSWQYLEDFLKEHEEYNNDDFILKHTHEPIPRNGNRF